MNARMSCQKRMHRVSQLADPLPVDDPQFADAALFTRGNELEDDILHVFRTESVKVQHTIDWEFYWLIAFFAHRVYQGNPSRGFISFPDSCETRPPV